jgi:hypothetical protein
VTSKSPLTLVPPPAELRAHQRERRTTAWDWLLFAAVVGAYVAMLAWALTMPAGRVR